MASPPPHVSVKRKGSYKISVDPDFEESNECPTPTEQDDYLSPDLKESHEPYKPSELNPESTGIESSPSVPVPAPRSSRASLYPPLPKPRTVHNVVPEPSNIPEEPEETPGSKPKPSLRKLQLSEEEKAELLSQDSDSETPASSSAASSSSSSKQHEGVEEEGYWSGGIATRKSLQNQLNRRCVRRRSEPPPTIQSQHGKTRSKFSPWNLSSPRLQQRFSVHRVGPSGWKPNIFVLLSKRL